MEKIKSNKMTNFYLVTPQIVIYDSVEEGKSNRTLTINVFILAQDKYLCGALNLAYIGQERHCTDKDLDWFIGYLCSFNQEKFEESYVALNANPEITILVLSEQMQEKVKKLGYKFDLLL